VSEIYGVDADVLNPPPAIVPALGDPASDRDDAPTSAYLCVSRLLPYKNVEAIVEAFARELPRHQLLVVGDGPHRRAIERVSGPNVRLLGTVSDGELATLYRQCAALVAASYEDYGLTPLEAASFGKPSVVLRYGGYLDTVHEGVTGLFFERPNPREISAAVRRHANGEWSPARIVAHAKRFSEARFIERLVHIVTMY
jgi:glycosyltransferase involved in cell wall biosynthesis